MKSPFVFLITLFLFGCSPSDNLPRMNTPKQATNITHIGNSWYTFKLGNQCFLAYDGFQRHALAKMECEKK